MNNKEVLKINEELDKLDKKIDKINNHKKLLKFIPEIMNNECVFKTKLFKHVIVEKPEIMICVYESMVENNKKYEYMEKINKALKKIKNVELTFEQVEDIMYSANKKDKNTKINIIKKLREYAGGLSIPEVRDVLQNALPEVINQDWR